ncbi:MAG: matrixin family metalloprotease, partial [Myxococcota bacterium]
MTNPHLPKATAALLFVSLMMLSTATSLAYNQTQTCNATGQYACEVGETPLPVYWPQRCIVYHINDQGTTDTDNEAAFQAIEDSFNQWSEPSCNNLKLTFGGFTNDDQVGYNQASPSDNANIIVFRDDNWPHSGGVLALTSVTFQPSTGKIFDADIELNTAEYRFSTTDNALRVGIDVANTLTHEAGHFLGLDHSGVSGSTMFATAPVGEVSKRDLAQDDIEGICSIYSSDTTAEDDACAGAPQGYFEKPPTTTQGNGTSSGTCGVLGTCIVFGSGVGAVDAADALN